MAEGTVVRDPPASLEAMAAVLVDEAAVDGALQLLVSLARASVHGADEVSVSAVCSRDLDTIGASSDDDRQLDAHQYSTGEGPCVSAIADGQVHNVALATARARWPNFAPEALARVWIDPLHPPTGTGPHHRASQRSNRKLREIAEDIVSPLETSAQAAS